MMDNPEYVVLDGASERDLRPMGEHFVARLPFSDGGSEGTIAFKVPAESVSFAGGGGSGGRRWSVSLPADIPLETAYTAYAAEDGGCVKEMMMPGELRDRYLEYMSFL